MHGFFYFALYNAQDAQGAPDAPDVPDAHEGTLWIDFSDLKILPQPATPLHVDFLQILNDKGISLQDLEISGQASDLQIESEHFETPLIFTFVKTLHFILMVVSESQLLPIFPLLEKTVQEFDDKFDSFSGPEISPSDIHSQSISIVSKHFSEFFLRPFLIPIKLDVFPSQKSENSETISDETPTSTAPSQRPALSIDYQTVYQAIDGVWTIRDLMERGSSVPAKMGGDILNILFSLWVQHWIDFRINFSLWDEFSQTEAAAPYMTDGSQENLKLIQKYNTAKIIRLLQGIGSGRSYQSLTQGFELTRTKLDLFLIELLAEKIIVRQPLILKIERISEDLLPLLSMQGFNKEDFSILAQLEEIVDGTQNLDIVALKLNIDPSRIHNLLGKLEYSLHVLQ